MLWLIIAFSDISGIYRGNIKFQFQLAIFDKHPIHEQVGGLYKDNLKMYTTQQNGIFNLLVTGVTPGYGWL